MVASVTAKMFGEFMANFQKTISVAAGASLAVAFTLMWMPFME